MSVTLTKGGNVSLSKSAPNLTSIAVGLGWDARSTTGADFDLDASALLTGENGKVHYHERLFVGYRYYDTRRIQPLFPFGFGLSYTTFAYGELHLSATEIRPGEILEVSVDVTTLNGSLRAVERSSRKT